MNKIHTLRKAGYKVRVMHWRYIPNCKPILPRHTISDFTSILPHGGKTEIEITAPDGTEFRGSAECSKKDNFNRKRGIQIALGRAMDGHWL